MDRKISGKRLRSAIYSHGVVRLGAHRAHRADQIAQIGRVLALKHVGGTLWRGTAQYYSTVLSGVSPPLEVDTDAVMTPAPRKGRRHAVLGIIICSATYLYCSSEM
jgi:hypothetical protein